MPAPEKPFISLLSGSTPEKASARSRPCLVSLFGPRFIPRLRNRLVPQSYDSCLQFRSVPLRFVSPSFQSSPLCIRPDILNVFTISSIHSSPFPPCLSAVSTFVLVSISTPMSSLRYRRYTLQFRSSPLSSPPFPYISVGNFQLLSPRLRQCTLVLRPSTFNTSRFPLGAPTVSIHLSQCRLLCPCIPYADVCVTVLDTSFISSSSSRLLAVSAVFPLQLFNNVRQIRVVNAILFCSFTGSWFRRVCSHLRLHLLLLHLSLTS
jgi:hypothetical protein